MRKVVQETTIPPSPPEKKRSRKGANSEAKLLLDSDIAIYGMDAMLTYISWSVASLGNIDSQCLDKFLSFVISPALTVFICAVSASISATARRSSSWFGMVVDASWRRPTDKAAMIHFKNWPYIKAVLAGNCERGGLSFPVD